MAESLTQHDERSRRCPMLGHDVPFRYCRAPGSDIPCRRIFDCWWEAFDVEAFVRAHYSDEQVEQILAPRQDKISSIVDLIQRAQRSQETQQ
jgi:hypothetical protein